MYQIAVIFLRCFVNGGVAAYRRARRHPTYLAQTIYGVFLGFMLSYCFASGLWPRLLRGLQSILTNPTVALTYCTAGGFLTADEIATKYVPGHKRKILPLISGGANALMIAADDQDHRMIEQEPPV